MKAKSVSIRCVASGTIYLQKGTGANAICSTVALALLNIGKKSRLFHSSQARSIIVKLATARHHRSIKVNLEPTDGEGWSFSIGRRRYGGFVIFRRLVNAINELDGWDTGHIYASARRVKS